MTEPTLTLNPNQNLNLTSESGPSSRPDPSENAYKKQERRIIAEDFEWNLAPIDKLTEMCVKAIISNFESTIIHLILEMPLIERIPEKYRDTVITQIPVTFPISIAGPLISDPNYWKRRVKAVTNVDSISDHGDSWKQMFFELHLRDQIESFEPTTDVNAMDIKLKSLMDVLALGAPFIETLHLRQLKPLIIAQAAEEDDKHVVVEVKKEVGLKDKPLDHLDIGIVLSTLSKLKELRIYYG